MTSNEPGAGGNGDQFREPRNVDPDGLLNPTGMPADASIGPPAGSIRHQDAETTRPRPPTVAEARARDKARKEQAELAEQQAEADEKRHKRNRRLLGGAAVVGVVGLVAVGYMALRPDNVTAQCVQMENGQEVIVADRYCSSGHSGMGGFIFIGGSQYRYNYGGTGTIGQAPRGGTSVAPKGATIKNSSGSTIQRGGFGSKVGGGKSGGS